MVCGRSLLVNRGSSAGMIRSLLYCRQYGWPPLRSLGTATFPLCEDNIEFSICQGLQDYLDHYSSPGTTHALLDFQSFLNSCGDTVDNSSNCALHDSQGATCMNPGPYQCIQLIQSYIYVPFPGMFPVRRCILSCCCWLSLVPRPLPSLWLEVWRFPKAGWRA